jgi:UDP-N-acetylglucosamine 2-epimerase (non-hydrolysing)
MSYLERSACVITDSGGIQEETTYLNVPCFTLRKNSERPVTMNQGSNRLIEPESLAQVIQDCLTQAPSTSVIPHLWDGKTAPRIVELLKKQDLG